MSEEYAPVDETAGGLPSGKYIGAYAGFSPRDEHSREPLISEWTSEEQVVSRRLRWTFLVLWPQEFYGRIARGSCPWKGISYVTDEEGKARLQIETKGTLNPWAVKWSEACGLDFKLDYRVPKVGVTEQLLVTKLEEALLQKSREGNMVLLEVGDRGFIGRRDSAESPVEPLPASSLKRVEGVSYTIPDPYLSGESSGQEYVKPVSQRYTEEQLSTMRQQLREILWPLARAGEKKLTTDVMESEGYLAKAIEQSKGDEERRASAFADVIVADGYDSLDLTCFVYMLSLASGAPVVEGLVDRLSPGQLERATVNVGVALMKLGKDVPLQEMEDQLGKVVEPDIMSL